MLMLTAGVAFAVLSVERFETLKRKISSNSFGPEAIEKLRLENKLGYLPVEDTKHTYFIDVPSFEPMTFMTRMYIIEKHRMKRLVVSTDPAGSSLSDWDKWEKTKTFPIDWIGFHEVTVKLRKNAQQQWIVSVEDEKSRWEVPLDQNDSNFLEPNGQWSTNFFMSTTRGINHRQAPGPISVLRIDAAWIPDLLKSFDATKGLHVWVE